MATTYPRPSCIWKASPKEITRPAMRCGVRYQPCQAKRKYEGRAGKDSLVTCFFPLLAFHRFPPFPESAPKSVKVPLQM